MSDHSAIEWTDASWPITTGCDHVSPGCDHCYAARLTSGRLAHLPEYAGLAVRGRFNGQIRLLPDRLDWPLRWRRPRRIFVASMSDLFHKDVPDEYLVRVFDTMANAQRHTFQVLTKRPGRMRSFVTRYLSGAFIEDMTRGPLAYTVNQPPPNVWLGISAEDQHWGDIRIPILLDTPAAVRFLSAEPLLGPIDLHDCAGCDALEPDWCGGPSGGTGAPHPFLNWVITGGESGPGARPANPDWFRRIRDQCVSADVAYLHKQNGGRTPKANGRELDGRTWDEYPNTTVMS